MAITYDAPSNTITVTGTYTDLFTDIWNADQAGGWGQVSKQGTHQFMFDCKLQIGDGETPTDVSDSQKQVVFNDALTANYQKFITRKASATMTFGVLEDATEKSTSKGVQFVVLQESFRVYLVYDESTSGSTNLYSCSFTSLVRTYLHVKNGKIFNNQLTSQVEIYPHATSEHFNIVIEKVEDYGILYPTGTWNKLVITDCGLATLFLRYEATMKNLYSRGCPRIVWAGGFKYGDFYLVNADSDNWTFYWSADSDKKVYRQYEFDAHCQDKDGNDLSGVSVISEYISPYGQAFSETTDENGNIPTQTVDHGWFDQPHGDTEQLKTPLKVTYSKAGYQTVVKYYPIDEKTKDTAVLHKAVGVFLDFGRPVINLKKTDPENKNVMVL